MRRRTALTLVLAPALGAAVALAAAGCTSTSTPATTSTMPTVVKAPPQTARLDWREAYPAQTPALVFGVSSFTVTREGWRADISVENRSDVSWAIGDPRYPTGLAFGVMLFPNDDLDELEQRNRNGTLPAIRPAVTYAPALPEVLRPSATWKGTISAPGALAGGLWVRLSFGPFVALGDPPPGAEREVVWFTDHAHRLETAAADPA